jgi:hypothetical protein
MFSNEGLGGGGQRAQRGGSMAGTVGRAISQHFSQETGMGHLEQQTNRVRQGWGRGGNAKHICSSQSKPRHRGDGGDVTAGNDITENMRLVEKVAHEWLLQFHRCEWQQKMMSLPVTSLGYYRAGFPPN